jgi:hypothetical protein
MGWTKTPGNLHFHCTLETIRPRRKPYANQPGSPWMSGTIDLSAEQARRLIDAFQGATHQMNVYSAHYHSTTHEPGNP